MAARRVLLIEDEAGARDALGSLLAEEGYLVCMAASGRTGLECARDFQPDTVVCDFLLPDIDGLEVLRQLRAMREHVFFIILTAGCGSGASERAARAEADLFLEKPVDLSRFRELLQRAGQDPGAAAPSAQALN